MNGGIFIPALYPCRPGAAQNNLYSILGRWGMSNLTTAQVESAFNQVDWSPAQVNSFSNSVVNGNAYTFCTSRDGVSHST